MTTQVALTGRVEVRGPGGVRRYVDATALRLPAGVPLSSAWATLSPAVRAVFASRVEAEAVQVRTLADRQRAQHAHEAGDDYQPADLTAPDPAGPGDGAALLKELDRAIAANRAGSLAAWRTDAEAPWTDRQLRAAKAASARYQAAGLTLPRAMRDACRAYERIARRRSRGDVTNPAALTPTP